MPNLSPCPSAVPRSTTAERQGNSSGDPVRDHPTRSDERRLAFLPLATLLLLIWNGFLYTVLLVLRFSQVVLSHRALELVIFAPGCALVIGLVFYEARARLRR